MTTDKKSVKDPGFKRGPMHAWDIALCTANFKKQRNTDNLMQESIIFVQAIQIVSNILRVLLIAPLSYMIQPFFRSICPGPLYIDLSLIHI